MDNLLAVPKVIAYAILDKLPLTDVINLRLMNRDYLAFIDKYLVQALVIKQLASGMDHTLVLLKRGRVLAMGSNDSGQLGLGETVKQAFLPTEITGMEPIGSISCGSSFSLLLSDEGNVWCMGSNKDKQLPVESSNAKIYYPQKKIVTHKYNFILAQDFTSVLKSTSNVVETFGHSGLQLRHLTDGLRLLPDGVNFSNIPSCVDVSSGVQHALSLTADGKIYGIGDNQLGFLGLGEALFFINEWSLLTSVTVKQFKATALGSIILGSDNKLRVSGINTDGQFGHDQNVIYNFTSIAENVDQFVASDSHMFYLDLTKKQWLGMGCNENGQLGIIKPLPERKDPFSFLKKPLAPPEKKKPAPLAGFFKLAEKLSETVNEPAVILEHSL